MSRASLRAFRIDRVVVASGASGAAIQTFFTRRREGIKARKALLIFAALFLLRAFA
jgi:hypothetical protein